jgi:cell wall-associated NlpC family hydrolase
VTQTEFVNRAIGLPWVRWKSDWSGADCFGLIVLYFREVSGIDLGSVPLVGISEGFQSAIGWQECSAEAGATCFMCWRFGAPTHCGLVLDLQTVLHAQGAEGFGGATRLSKLSAVRKLWPDIRFYKYSPC